MRVYTGEETCALCQGSEQVEFYAYGSVTGIRVITYQKCPESVRGRTGSPELNSLTEEFDQTNCNRHPRPAAAPLHRGRGKKAGLLTLGSRLPIGLLKSISTDFAKHMRVTSKDRTAFSLWRPASGHDTSGDRRQLWTVGEKGLRFGSQNIIPVVVPERFLHSEAQIDTARRSHGFANDFG